MDNVWAAAALLTVVISTWAIFRQGPKKLPAAQDHRYACEKPEWNDCSCPSCGRFELTREAGQKAMHCRICGLPWDEWIRFANSSKFRAMKKFICVQGGKTVQCGVINRDN